MPAGPLVSFCSVSWSLPYLLDRQLAAHRSTSFLKSCCCPHSQGRVFLDIDLLSTVAECLFFMQNLACGRQLPAAQQSRWTRRWRRGSPAGGGSDARLGLDLQGSRSNSKTAVLFRVKYKATHFIVMWLCAAFGHTGTHRQLGLN